MSSIRFRFRWPWQATGRHYKLMAWTGALALATIPLLWIFFSHVAAIAVYIFLLTLAVQWLCIEPPNVEEKDLH